MPRTFFRIALPLIAALLATGQAMAQSDAGLYELAPDPDASF